MVVDVVIKSTVNVIDLRFDPKKNLLIVGVLLSVPLVELCQSPHQRTADNSNDNGNPPHRSHPPLPNRLGLNTSISGLLLLQTLTLGDRRTMEIFFPMAKAKTDTLYMALKANSATTRKNVKRK
ncbi:MAG: hypothetical protein EBZ16_08165 [Flavobacteriia bacterium]|nr:hypothetical protein [Flavobacteriia bacterium]NDA07697.1 hypothetical protein [Flavobacteriia bacterium]NDA28732.1 hypothetical protein [Flavobacteriia bacterium]NDD20334.1 hypothetical protein [Flavobacteriia bacterium]